MSLEEIGLLIAVTAGLIVLTIYRSNKILTKLGIPNTDSKKKDPNR
ncbi:hypothetical protein SATMO3_26400 [Sporomusa aerivorans]